MDMDFNLRHIGLYINDFTLTIKLISFIIFQLIEYLNSLLALARTVHHQVDGTPALCFSTIAYFI